jgi:predicted enzyme related to lactoylglutathione lyase
MYHISGFETILYVKDQQKSTDFYAAVLRKAPDLNVPGMTEFRLSTDFILGLMPNEGIAKILTLQTLHPAQGEGIPRCELYLQVENVEIEYRNAIEAGAEVISPPQDRDWGDRVCYLADPDSHILAFAQKT